VSNKWSNTPANYAARYSSDAVVRSLIDAGAQTWLPNHDGWYALCMCCQRADEEAVTIARTLLQSPMVLSLLINPPAVPPLNTVFFLFFSSFLSSFFFLLFPSFSFVPRLHSSC
jgi:hypothetical protein